MNKNKKEKTPKDSRTLHLKKDDGLLSKITPDYWACKDRDITKNIQHQPWRERLIRTMHAWVLDDKSVEMTDFYRLYGVSRHDMKAWCKTYPDVKEAYENMGIFLVGNRRKHAMWNMLNWNVAKDDLHLYDEVAAQIRDERFAREKELKLATLEAEKEKHHQTINVILPDPKVESKTKEPNVTDVKE